MQGMLPSEPATQSKQSLKQRRILLVAAEPLTRGSIAHFLHSASPLYDVVEVESSAALAECGSPPRPIELIILNIGPAHVSDEHVRTEVAQLRSRFADVPLALFANQVDIADVQSALRMGVRACIPAHLSGLVALAGLRVVLAGGIFVPASPSATEPLRLDVCPHHDLPIAVPHRPDQPNGVAHHRLTLRETDVLRLLRQGKTNRDIACELSIAESTAKVHVRSIRRKFNAVNRLDIVGVADATLAADACVGGNGQKAD